MTQQKSKQQSKLEILKEIQKRNCFRFNIFLGNLKKIQEHNNRPGETWKMAVTEFADLTEEQFRDTVLGQGYIRTPMNGQGRIRWILVRYPQ